MFFNSCQLSFFKIFCFVLTFSFLSACTGVQVNSTSEEFAFADPVYRLDTGDRVRVTVHEQPELSNSYSVSSSGHISMPLAGNVLARGKTIGGLKSSIESSLRRKYVRKPSVSVDIDVYRPFFIMGEVQASGQYSYVPGLTVGQAVAVAGGYTPRAAKGRVAVTRYINGEEKTAVVPMNTPIQPGDVVTIMERYI